VESNVGRYMKPNGIFAGNNWNRVQADLGLVARGCNRRGALLNTKIRVAVVDVYPMFREGVVYTLEACSDMVVVGRGASDRDVARIARECEPDVIMLDLEMLGPTLTLADEVLAQHPAGQILALTTGEEEARITSALKRGIRGFLAKGANAQELVQAVRALHRGEHYVSPAVAARLLMRSAAPETRAQRQSDPLSELTRREEEILYILVEGCSNKEIGNKLALSEKTIKHHVTNILQKLQVRNRVEAALLASGRARQRAVLTQ
jgi:two-component system nitrate/nitrite response regulator NarL